MTGPKTAMVLAAGLGTRMRPLTDDRSKALVEVGGRALIDHVLDRLADAGVERAVVNVHWVAERLEAHLAARTGGPEIVISDERAELLETGGEPVDIDHRARHARIGQPVQHMVDQGLAAHLHQRLGPVVGQGPHAGAEPGGQHHRGLRTGHRRASTGTCRSNQPRTVSMPGF